MLTLSHGYKKPETGDRGSVWFPALEDDIQRLNDHDHDGINSELIPASSINKYDQTLSFIDWVSDGGGTYSQVVTTPAGIVDINDYFIKFYNAANGHQLHLSWERLTATTYTVRINDSSLNVVALYV